MSFIVNSPDVLLALQQRKRYIKMKMEASRTQMKETANCLTGRSAAKTSNRAQAITRLIINGIVFYKGYRFCSNVFTGINSLFSFRKRRRR